jgi:hypothetical protein
VVLADQARFLKAAETAANRSFALDGERYKKHPPVPAGAPEAIADLTRRRNIYLCRTMAYEPLLLSAELAETLAADYAALGAMYRLFCLANDRSVHSSEKP